MTRLQAAGGEAYLVGGAVRDLLLGQVGQDYDICSSFLPEQIPAVFPEYVVLPTGVKYGTVTLRLEHESYEITSLRSESPYSDGRRPDKVEFGASLEEDLARRDFTINALALDLTGQLHDPWQGRVDLEQQLIRAVGDPGRRFAEDGLRLLRAVRLAAKLGFTIEPQTAAAIKANSANLLRVSRERIAAEFLQILAYDLAAVRTLYELDLLEYICPALAACFTCEQETPWHKYNVGEHLLATAQAGSDLEFRLAALLHDVGKVQCKSYDAQGQAHFYGHSLVSAKLAAEFLAALFLPRRQRQRILFAIKEHDFNSVKKAKLAALCRQATAEELDLLIRLQKADVAAQSDLQRAEKLALIAQREAVLQQLLAGPRRETDLALSGRELAACGLQGPAIAQMKKRLLEQVMLEPALNTPAKLLSLVQRWVQS